MPSFDGAEYWVEARAEQNAYVACACTDRIRILSPASKRRLISSGYRNLRSQTGPAFCPYSLVRILQQRRWSLVKILFLWSRYYGVAFNVSNAVIYLYLYPSLNVSSTFFYWQNTGASLQVITSHELRLYAMYGNSCKILGLFVVMTVLECLTMGLIFGLPGSGTIGTNEPIPGLFMCADADPPDHHWIVYYWVAVLIIESILLSLALRQAWLHRPSASGSDLMRKLTRDSVIYFLVLFGIYLTNLIFWIRNRITLNEFGTAFAFVISSLFANRLLSEVTTEIRFRRETVTGDVDDYDTMELRNITRDFNEVVGV
ncbi:uncharacterized protein EV420DRAFT_815032 [Desarmillaria tabescens]|uniref:Uncharacterized protein n=1 Tax=Armillaria tabescens TaxID=1929756 RepID=A0AA39NIC8_ARMTA|nr:uncharacterized protein EV420DRAFT_815032 [Desarmillaria tabescens]KAK0466188.1 hypothetical protein EV420DRAFT_815032 [Desarmillaria tabescens]